MIHPIQITVDFPENAQLAAPMIREVLSPMPEAQVSSNTVIVNAGFPDVTTALKSVWAIRKWNVSHPGSILSISGYTDELYIVWPLPELFAEYVTMLTEFYNESREDKSKLSIEKQLHDYVWCFSYAGEKQLDEMFRVYFDADFFAKALPGCTVKEPNAFPPDRLIFSVDDKLNIRYSFLRD